MKSQIQRVVTHLQDAKFNLRVRSENPMDAYQKVKNDIYFATMYADLAEVMVSRLDKGTKSQKVIELGSAGGITKELYPEIVTSDIREVIGVDSLIDATKLPFADSSIDGYISKDVLHHLPNAYEHFAEISRTLRSNGKCIYIEPNWGVFSKLVFFIFHPEPWNENQQQWDFMSHSPMYSNQALAKIIFVRDADIFQSKYPLLQFHIESIPLNGLTHLLSGGLYARKLFPRKLLMPLYRLEKKSKNWLKFFGFARIIILTKM